MKLLFNKLLNHLLCRPDCCPLRSLFQGLLNQPPITFGAREAVSETTTTTTTHQGRVPGREAKWVVGLVVTFRRPLFFLFDLPHDSCFKHGETIVILPSRPLKKSSNMGSQAESAV
jgi:hypothetical protein